MVHKVVKTTKFVFDIIKTEDAVLEQVVFSQIGTFLTAAWQNWIDEEDWDSWNQEYWVLQDVDNQVHIETWLFDSCVRSRHALILHLIFPRFVFLLDQVDSVANDSCLEDPFGNCKGSETLITARFHQEAIAEEIVEEIEYHIATCQAINFATESQIDQ